MNKRLIFLILGVVVAAELLWAGWTLSRQTTLPVPVSQKKDQVGKPTAVSLTSDKKTIKKGEKMTVTINISSEKNTTGTDLIILYDPKFLQAEGSVVLGNLYEEYPVNKVDPASGKITVSGISSKNSLANGVFGRMVFTGKAAGSTKISLDFNPNSTADSNVSDASGKDILEKVNNLEVTISP